LFFNRYRQIDIADRASRRHRLLLHQHIEIRETRAKVGATIFTVETSQS